MTIKLARDLPAQPFNTTIPRFHSKFWTIDYNALMVGTIIQVDERGFKIPSQWRTNSDFMGVKWISEDKLSHEYFKYSTDNNYRDTVLAFRANPSEPSKFTATITTGAVPLTYRLVPYALNPATNRYEPLDTEYNTGRTYPLEVMRAQGEWSAIPDEDMVPFKGRSDYIFILDFSDMRMFSQFNGPVIVPEEISSISFDTIEWNHGLGKDAMVQSMEQIGDRVKVKITGAVPGAILTPGDRLTVLGKFRTTTTTTIGTGRGNYYDASLPSAFAPERVRPRPANRDVWPAAAERTWLIGVKVNDAPALAPLSETAKAFISVQGVRNFQVNYEDGVFDYWEEPWQVNGMDVTNIEVASWSPTYVAMWVTFKTKGLVADQMNWGRQIIPGGDSYFSMQWANVTYPCYAVSSQETQFVVEDWEGFGTGEITVWYTGQLIGDFIGCDTFYSRYLAATAPAEVVNSTKYYVDMTTTGARTTILQKNHPQPVHDLMMTSGFDDGYNMTPARQVDAVYGLGYRGHWTKYLGMSHYFNGRTAWQDKITGEVIPVGRPNDISVMFAGDQAVGGHFTTGLLPDRGLEEFQREASQRFGVAYGQVLALNGAVGSTSADRAAAFDPNDTKFDPDAGLPGGLWWWDLEANEPGPALLNCINHAIRGQPPRAVVWGCGQQDFQAIASPGIRNPVPTVERTAAATKAVFAYMRSKWGADLPIFIQGIGWIWDAQSGSAAPGLPMYLSSVRNSWGDVVFRWLSYDDNPAAREYLVDIYHPNKPNEILRTYSAPGGNIHDGFITFDWTVELNVGPAIEVFGDQFPWSYLRWRVRRADDPDYLVSKVQEQFVELSNAKVVKKLCLLGINSLIGGYFNDLSDTLNPGGSGRPGRKDVVAASTFRKTLAQKAGLRDVEVMPVMTVIGSSPINPMPYQPGFPLTNYWWDPVTNSPGPNLLIANDIVKDLGMPPSLFVESGPGETTGIPYAPAAERPAILEAWRTSNIAMLAWMRENWGNEAMEIWFQGATTSFWGDPPPADVNAEGTQLIRDLQTSMALEGIGFKVGSYVPDSNKWETFRNEMADGIGWVHYSVEGYHAAATEMGEAIALNINRAMDPPEWATLRQPTGLNVVRKPNNDIHITWDTRPNFDRWYFKNMRGDTLAVITEGVLAVAEFVFTEAEQIAAYGGVVDYLVFDVSEYIVATALVGPATRFVGSPGSGDGDLASITGLTSAVQLNGDIVTTWTQRPEHGDFYYRNLLSSTGAVLSEGPLTTASVTFTVAQQIAAYGFPVTYSRIEVAEYDPALDITGPFSVWNDEAIAPLNPLAAITGFEAHFAGEDIVMTWNASPVPGRKYRLRNLRADTSAIISDSVLASPTFTFTGPEQIAAYGFYAGYIAVEVMEHDDALNLDGPVYLFGGSPTA